MRIQLRFLGYNRGIDIAQTISLFEHHKIRSSKELKAVRAFMPGVGVGKVFPDVSERRRPQ